MTSMNAQDTTSTNPFPPQEAANALFTNTTILAPMVRASTTPLRILALSHGASLTFTEEFIDRSILDTVRIENAELGTIDYVKPLSSFPNKVQKRMVADVDNPDTKNGAILLRIDPKKEKNKLVYQIGTGESGLAIQAVNRIINDVAGVDVNMGCPKKFSVSGGMGSALLSDPKRACDIISTISRNITKPVSAKIRLLHPTDPRPTLEFVRSLIQAGANAITIHGRIVGDESQTDARWNTLVQVVKILKETEVVPIIINGDLYTHADIGEMKRRTGCDGVMLARPALYNISLINHATNSLEQPNVDIKGAPLSTFQTFRHSGDYGYDSPLLLSRTSVIQEYVSNCVRYRTHSKNAKYVVCEMMNARRHPTSRVPFLNMSFESGQTVNDVCQCRSLNDLVKVWDVKLASSLNESHVKDKASSSSMSRSGGMGDLHNYSDDYFLNPEKFHRGRAATADKSTKTYGENADEKKMDEENGDPIPLVKRQKR